jgi:DNA-binding transcriptional ArsR family regulator
MRYIKRMNATTLTALAEPNRIRIVEYLREGPRAVGEIAEGLKLRQPQVSKHLRVLNEAGFVEMEPIANQRVYSLRADRFQELDKWLETFNMLWESRLDAMDEIVQELEASRKTEAETKPKET